jgi:AraC family transcriptional regulator
LRISKTRRASTSSAYLERVNRAIDYIVDRLSEPLRLGEVARAARLSPFHFHRVFQALLGETPGEFAKRLRLEKALGMMTHARPGSLTTIALACGFASSSDFSRCFKQRFGVAPSAFDIGAWREAHADALAATIPGEVERPSLRSLPPRHNPDQFRVKIRDLPARTVAYIRVARPYEGDGVIKAIERLMSWAERHGCADSQWLGYQWDNPEITSLEDCRYYVAVVAEDFVPKGEIGRYEFPPMVIAEIEIRGDINLELRALQWFYGSWLPRSRYVPDDQPSFEAWIGRPFANGFETFALRAQLPIRTE